MIVIVGKSIFGKRSTPRLKNENAPTTTSDMINIVANTGRLTQTSANHCIKSLVLLFASPLLFVASSLES